jgi:hypothetical protein
MLSHPPETDNITLLCSLQIVRAAARKSVQAHRGALGAIMLRRTWVHALFEGWEWESMYKRRASFIVRIIGRLRERCQHAASVWTLQASLVHVSCSVRIP